MSNRDGSGSSTPPERGYTVGYGKPPKEYQFKPTESGNRAGRPRRTKPARSAEMDLYGAMSIALNKKVSVVEGGKKRKVSIRDVDCH